MSRAATAVPGATARERRRALSAAAAVPSSRLACTRAQPLLAAITRSTRAGMLHADFLLYLEYTICISFVTNFNRISRS